MGWNEDYTYFKGPTKDYQYPIEKPKNPGIVTELNTPPSFSKYLRACKMAGMVVSLLCECETTLILDAEFPDGFFEGSQWTRFEYTCPDCDRRWIAKRREV